MCSEEKTIGVGWITIIEYSYPSGFFSLKNRQGDINFRKNQDYWRAIYDSKIKTSTVEDLIKLKEQIDEKYSDTN